jgi:molybdopterin converting factor small subunit
MARVLFFGKLADLAGTSELNWPNPSHVSEIKLALCAQNDALANELNLPTTRAALNLAILGQYDDPLVQAGDELAFMPPVSGG